MVELCSGGRGDVSVKWWSCVVVAGVTLEWKVVELCSGGRGDA